MAVFSRGEVDFSGCLHKISLFFLWNRNTFSVNKSNCTAYTCFFLLTSETL